MGTTFTSSGDRGQGHVPRPVGRHGGVAAARFVIETDSRLDRKSAETWEAHFSHRYDIEPDGAGSQDRVHGDDRARELRALLAQAWHPNLFRPLVNRADRKQLRNLARLAEERADELIDSSPHPA